MRICAVVETFDNEISTFRVTTGERDIQEYNDLADAMRDFVAAMQSQASVVNVLGESNLTNVTVETYLLSQSRWVQVRNNSYTGVTKTANTLPLQDALVVTLRVDIPPVGATLQQYRNRFYVGPLAASIIGAGGKVAGAGTTDLVNQVFDFDAALQTIPVKPGAPADSPAGLAVTSVVGGHVTQADTIDVGNVIDTQRRRRNGLVETRASRSITL